MSKTSQRKVSVFNAGRYSALMGEPRWNFRRFKGRRHPLSGVYHAGYSQGLQMRGKGIVRRGGIFSKAYNALMKLRNGGKNG